MASQGKRMVPEALIKKLQDFSNNGLAALTAGNITTLTTNQINDLKCGDIVLKEDSTGKHAYIVSYKKDGTGICLTYADASVVETVSYDYSGSAWVYNSTDITSIKNVVANPTLAGTEANLTGLQVGDTKYAMPHLYEVKGEFYIYDTNNKVYRCSLRALTKDNKDIEEDYNSLSSFTDTIAFLNTLHNIVLEPNEDYRFAEIINPVNMALRVGTNSFTLVIWSLADDNSITYDTFYFTSSNFDTWDEDNIPTKTQIF